MESGGALRPLALELVRSRPALLIRALHREVSSLRGGLVRRETLESTDTDIGCVRGN